MKIYDNIHEAYLGTLEDVFHNPDYRSAPRGLPIREKIDYSFRVLSPTSEPIITKDLERNKVIEDYTRREMELYNSCSNRVEDFAKASKFWEKLANPDGTINSAYGYLIWYKRSHGNPAYESWGDKGNGVVMDFSAGSYTPWEWARDS